MLKSSLITLFVRDLNKLHDEIAAYKSESSLWQVDRDIPNSAGNLCLHLVGNLNTFIGAELGNSGYVRHRDLEFSSKNIPKAELLQKVKDTIVVVEQSLNGITDASLDEAYPKVVLKEATATGFLLVHLLAHLSYHLGQINYHRRLLD